MLRIESRIEPGQVGERPEQEAGSHQKHDAEGNLRDDEHAAWPVAGDAGDRSPARRAYRRSRQAASMTRLANGVWSPPRFGRGAGAAVYTDRIFLILASRSEAKRSRSRRSSVSRSCSSAGSNTLAVDDRCMM